ncbi:MAG: MBL fold metallo-hydrolase [Lachnospiraceae bacterium]|nr:MBL fold metallo-hydrolase [Lachnospiraceae bacterium]
MKVKIIGSGGCVSIPRPCCSCRVCREAREKGVPYARSGCSLYIEDAGILIDTPEDINQGLNHANVETVDCVLFSHTDPDHTMGMRVFEQLRMDWLGRSVGKECTNPIEMAALPCVVDGLRKQATRFGSVLSYYEICGLVRITGCHVVEKGSLRIDLIPVDETEQVTVFVLTEAGKKIIYAPCDVKPFPENPIFEQADVLIIGNTIVGDVLKNGFVMEADNPLKTDLFDMDEILALKKKYQIRQVVITHLEEDWGKSYDDYLELEKEYDGIRFAFDGMEIETD